MKEAIAEAINYIDLIEGFCQDPVAMGHIREKLQTIMDNMDDPPTGLSNSDFIDEVIEMVYQELNDGGYGLSAKNAHKLTLFIRKLLTPKAELGLNNQVKDVASPEQPSAPVASHSADQLLKHYKPPFLYDEESGGYVFDNEGHMIMEVRGWGRFCQTMDEEQAWKVQNEIGVFLTDMLNRITERTSE